MGGWIDASIDEGMDGLIAVLIAMGGCIDIWFDGSLVGDRSINPSIDQWMDQCND